MKRRCKNRGLARVLSELKNGPGCTDLVFLFLNSSSKPQTTNTGFFFKTR